MEPVTSSPVRQIFEDLGQFSRVLLPGLAMRGYQRTPAQILARAVIDRRRGVVVPGEYAAVFSRQAGKDEMLAQLLVYLLVLFGRTGGSIVVVLPTLRPQGMIARDRLIERLSGPRVRAVTQGVGLVSRREGAIVQLGRASVRFTSAAPASNARGQTASLLLVANECQDIEPDRWDAVFAPMAAASDAVTLYMGTVWSAQTLLARQMRYLRSLEMNDSQQRLFLTPWRAVAAELPAYGRYVERQMAQLGADHPFIRTEYELEELDGAGGLFPAGRQGQMQGAHPPLARGLDGETYALLVDVAGEEEEVADGVQQYDPHSRRDSTALTVVRVVMGQPPERAGSEREERPHYEVVRRYLWTGVKHTVLHDQLVDLARRVWKARCVVVDATGVGAGLTSFLRASLGDRVVLPFVFSLSSKSQLGWDYLGIVDSGRFKDYQPASDDREAAELSRLFWRQVDACTYVVRPGPGKLLSWSVPDARTHDDLLVSAALCGVLDGIDWRPRAATGRVRVQA